MSTAIDGWESKRLGEIGTSLIGLTYDPASVKPRGTLVLRSSNIQDGLLYLNDNVFVDTPVTDRIRVRESDILICVRNGSRRLIGKSVMLDRRVVGQTFGAFMAVYRSDINSFLRWFFQSDDFKRQIHEHLGATINQITNASLNGFVVSLPSARERDEISSRLDDVDRLIASLGRMIAKKQAVKTGMMQELLSGSVRLPGFARPRRAGTFEDIAVPIRERTTPSDVAPQMLLVELEHIESGSGRLIVRSNASSAVSIKTVFREGDVLFGKLRAYLRKYWLADSAGICTTEIWAFRAKPGSVGGFVRYVVETDRFIEVATGAYGTHMPRSDWGVVRRLAVEIPEKDEQVAIAQVLRDADTEVARLHSRMSKAKALKQGMIQELLSGRTRLVVAGDPI